jgi:hypothetical protein
MTTQINKQDRHYRQGGGLVGTILLFLGMFGGPFTAPIIGLIGFTTPVGSGADEVTMLDWALGHLPAIDAAVDDFAHRGSSATLAAVILVGQIVAETASAGIVLITVVGLAITRRSDSVDKDAIEWAKAATSLWYLPAYGILVLLLPLVIHDLAMGGRLYETYFDLAPTRLRWMPGYAIGSSCGLIILNFVYLVGVVGVLSTLTAAYDKTRDWVRSKSTTG